MQAAIDVLLVEDDPDLRQATTFLFEDGGLTVLATVHGADALSALGRGYRPQVIVLDLMMPVMDGHEFLERLSRLEPELARLPVVVMTASHVASVPRAQVVVRKPFDVDDVIRILRPFVVRASIPR